MLFNSVEFFIFLPTVFCLYWFVFNRSLRLQNTLILVASYFFYGYWSNRFLGLLLLSTCLDYLYAFQVASSNRKRAKLFLWLSILNNLGILGFFKYYNFFVAEFQHGFGLLGLQVNPTLLEIALPVGISFYTFHGLSYVFDVYRNRQKPVANFIDYAVFVGFFPLLVAGPIERAHHLLPQVQRKRVFDYAQAVEGCRLILWGLFKKVVIADHLATIVNTAFENYREMNGVSLIVGAIAFSFQIYADFSGYSDIAIGAAKLFGFEVLSNFRFPYFSRDVAEFWRRWHISLSSWFRDYLYIPLGGSGQGKNKAIRNVFIIFMVSGFWHGASLTYIAWGFINACGFIPLLLLNRNRVYVSGVVAEDRMMPNYKEVFQMGATFAFITIAWVFFRARTISIAVGYLRHIAASIYKHPGQFLHMPDGSKAFVYIIPFIVCDWWLRRDERKLKRVHPVVYLAIAALIFYSFGGNHPFIYFQF